MKNRDTHLRVADEARAETAGPLVVIMAGGTGGHVFPALAVAARLSDAGCRILWMGSRDGMEAQLVPRHGYEMAWVSMRGLRGKGLMTRLLLPVRLLGAFWQALAILVRAKPAVVIGFGGYISFPGGMMAALLGRPLALHEQNAIAGLSNRVLARVADRVLTAFPDVLKGGEWVGNPVRKEIVALPSPEDRYGVRQGPLRVLVVGGSLGARALNEVVPAALAAMPEAARPVVVHQSGRANAAALEADYARRGLAATTLEFIEDMARAYADADLVICRAGAMTVAEVACAGVAALFVPFPFAVDDHQAANARFLADREAALMVRQNELDAGGLAAMLGRLTRAACQAMASKARGFARPDADLLVARACMNMAGAA